MFRLKSFQSCKYGISAVLRDIKPILLFIQQRAVPFSIWRCIRQIVLSKELANRREWVETRTIVTGCTETIRFLVNELCFENRNKWSKQNWTNARKSLNDTCENSRDSKKVGIFTAFSIRHEWAVYFLLSAYPWVFVQILQLNTIGHYSKGVCASFVLQVELLSLFDVPVSHALLSFVEEIGFIYSPFKLRRLLHQHPTAFHSYVAAPRKLWTTVAVALIAQHWMNNLVEGVTLCTKNEVILYGLELKGRRTY